MTFVDSLRLPGHGGDTVFHGNVLPHQPSFVHPQRRSEETGDVRPGNRFAADVLAHMAFAEFDALPFGRMHEIDLFHLAQRHGLVEAIGERCIGHDDLQFNSAETLVQSLTP